MYGRDLGQKIFLENVHDDVVKTFFKYFSSYIKMFDECFVNRAQCGITPLYPTHIA